MTGLEAATLVIAVLALLASVISLTWQVVEWKLNGSVVKVELLAGAAGQGGVAAGSVKNFSPSSLSREGFVEMLFIVRARNVGRSAVDITHWSVASPKGFALALTAYRLNRNLPYRLESGSKVDFHVPMQDVFRLVAAVSAVAGPRKKVRGVITLATGRERRSRRHKLPKVKFE
jgi:hypothetical protein